MAYSNESFAKQNVPGLREIRNAQRQRFGRVQVPDRSYRNADGLVQTGYGAPGHSCQSQNLGFRMLSSPVSGSFRVGHEK